MRNLILKINKNLFLLKRYKNLKTKISKNHKGKHKNKINKMSPTTKTPKAPSKIIRAPSKMLKAPPNSLNRT
jgi:hypothetical protein